MRELIINADDFGMSEAFNHGVMKGVRDGCISSTTMIVNLPAAPHAAQLAREFPQLFVGLHINMVLGVPCADPGDIPALVDENGLFPGSGDYKTGKRKFVYEQVRIEVKAQMERFKALTGAYPRHMESHSAEDEHAARAIYELAEEHGAHCSIFSTNAFPVPDRYRPAWFVGMRPGDPDGMQGYSLADFTEDRFGLLQQPEGTVMELHCHPGYVDQYILDHSTLTVGRCRDLDTLCQPQLKQWLAENDIRLPDFRALDR